MGVKLSTVSVTVSGDGAPGDDESGGAGTTCTATTLYLSRRKRPTKAQRVPYIWKCRKWGLECRRGGHSPRTRTLSCRAPAPQLPPPALCGRPIPCQIDRCINAKSTDAYEPPTCNLPARIFYRSVSYRYVQQMQHGPRVRCGSGLPCAPLAPRPIAVDLQRRQNRNHRIHRLPQCQQPRGSQRGWRGPAPAFPQRPQALPVRHAISIHEQCVVYGARSPYLTRLYLYLTGRGADVSWNS